MSLCEITLEKRPIELFHPKLVEPRMTMRCPANLSANFLSATELSRCENTLASSVRDRDAGFRDGKDRVFRGFVQTRQLHFDCVEPLRSTSF